MKIVLNFALFFCLVSQSVWASLPDFTQLVEHYEKAVVNISSSQKVRHRRSNSGHLPGFPEDSPLSELFKHFERYLDNPKQELYSKSLGSGFIISEDGYILTNYHVVNNADEIVVRLSDRREFIGQIIGSDERSDIALVKINAKNLPTVKVGSAENLKVGEWVLAIGSPFGFEHSVTAGIVSAKGRSLPSENYVPFIQTDVAINPGNSGGPLFNLEGEVIGVNSQIYSRSGGFMGLSFSIPIDLAMNVVDQIKTKGHVSRGWLGVLIQDVTRELADSFGMPQPHGALVAEVFDDSPAKEAGIEVGDIIVKYNGKTVDNSATLPPLVGASKIGRPSDVEVLRNGELTMLNVTIAELPDDNKSPARHRSEIQPKQNRLGLVIEDLNDQQQQQLGLSYGVRIKKVKPNSIAEAFGLQAGDVLLRIQNQKIQSSEQFIDVVEKLPAGKTIAVLVHRHNSPVFLALRLPEK